ncbi:primosomal protein N' [uncultured Methylophaga sp.]|uniref:primosomal protein N' n=1 Tax=uncultured Methylophaga sp. TaxID=285271 RepID=UPI00262E9D61|nr:primosomal protein N' [uncultured Methylophaga sp.]
MASIVHLAIPTPLRQLFDYLTDKPASFWQSGMRVRVNFAGRSCIAIVIRASDVQSNEEGSKLKSIDEIIDAQPLLPEEVLQTVLWVSRYYHHPLGECLQTVLPKRLRKGDSSELQHEAWWFKNEDSDNKKTGEKQQAILSLLEDYPEGISQSAIKAQLGNVSTSLKSLQQQQRITQKPQAKLPIARTELNLPCALNSEQQQVVDEVWQSREQFQPFLLEGITGSGKTEAYIALSEKMLAAGRQVLILIPEIGLTGQFVERFKQRLNTSIVVLNSAISDGERKQGWLLAREGLGRIIIGTRSAVFTPLPEAGLIIIDEEHDSSYKQQDGLRYHARQVALIRAQKMGVPVLMGSATPSLESLYQVKQQRFRFLQLQQRATGASLPAVHLIDSQGAHPDHGLTEQLLKKMHQHLEAGNQVILFINRRGYAPVLMCHDCGWQAQCNHCDARMVVHKQRHILFCHHCGSIQRLPDKCPECESKQLKSYGAGTEKIEQHLQTLFPDTPVIRVDRDSTQRVNAFDKMVSEIRQGQARILVGTQMLAKGHDFHDVTLVGVLDTDQGLYSADFRATENLAQMITQVTGRAGRGAKEGEVLIQSEQPQHPFWRNLIREGYALTADKLLQERIEMGMPPASHWAVIRAEAKDRSLAMDFLGEVAGILGSQSQQTVMVMGPVPAIMEKKGGRYRAQLLLNSAERKPLHQLLDRCTDSISRHKLARKLRWSMDIDPIDLL